MAAVAPVSAPPEDRPRHALVAAPASASLLVCMIFNVVIPLIPVLPGELGTSPSSTSWVATGFFLTGAVANPVAGRLADMFGNRRVFVICIWLLIVGSVVCALAPNLAVLLVGRVLHGMSLPMMSISLSIMRHQLVIRRLPAAVGWATAAMGIGSRWSCCAPWQSPADARHPPRMRHLRSRPRRVSRPSSRHRSPECRLCGTPKPVTPGTPRHPPPRRRGRGAVAGCAA
ncbi:MFS transporter [Aeromicrobium ginsengisoli]|uniref:MFS transporter n=1 Tax=Aeromicrobium ginsengisoli TaxID=363867 RepID=A0A5M4FAP3_9ACTN|nr:MFS transporter [Aeromicrobium ginsengisoli]